MLEDHPDFATYLTQLSAFGSGNVNAVPEDLSLGGIDQAVDAA